MLYFWTDKKGDNRVMVVVIVIVMVVGKESWSVSTRIICVRSMIGLHLSIQGNVFKLVSFFFFLSLDLKPVFEEKSVLLDGCVKDLECSRLCASPTDSRPRYMMK
jgi:hypothetical protein